MKCILVAIVCCGISCTLAQTSLAVELTPVRRTTIVTADPEASLKFYRDLLGFIVEYDVRSTDSASLAILALGATEGRAIALRYGPKLGGSIGLFWAPGLKPPSKPCANPAPAGATAMLLLTDDLSALKERLDKAGVLPVAPSISYEHNRGPTDAYAVFDPNCVRVTFAEKHTESLTESMQK